MLDTDTRHSNNGNTAVQPDSAAIRIARSAALMVSWILFFNSHLWAQQSLKEYIYLDDRLIAVETRAAAKAGSTLASISPTSETVGGAAFNLTATGSDYVSAFTVGRNRNNPFISSAQLRSSLAAADRVSVGTSSAKVLNPTPGGGASSGRTFTISHPVRSFIGINSTSAMVRGAPFALTAAATNSITGSLVR